LRILIVNDYGVPSGGAERVSFLLRDGLRARGHDARLFAARAQPTPQRNAADFTCFGSERLRRVLQVANPWAASSLRRTVAEFRPDIVHVRMFLTQLSPLVLAALRGVPCIFHAVNYQAVCPLNTRVLPDGRACMEAAGWTCRRRGCVGFLGLGRTLVQLGLLRRSRGIFTRVVANSHGLARFLRDGGLVVDGVIPNGAAIVPARPPLGGPPTIGFAGRFVPKKGLQVLVAAMARVVAQVREARLLIAGDGPDRHAVRRAISERALDGHVALLGHLSAGELESALAAAWVQAVPSTYEEPFANVALEAMMRGTAVVGSAAGGMPEIVRDGHTGYLVPRGDASALADALLRLLRDRDRAEVMGAAGREWARAELTDDRMVERFVETYERVIREPAACAY
jgi:glycosyltransferase involved in cell wall biosynthesis